MKKSEKDKDDSLIYDQHKKDTAPEIIDLDDEEAMAMMEEDGMEITEADDLDEEESTTDLADEDLDDGTVDLGEEF